MSNSGINYTKDKRKKRNLLDRRKKHPIRLFIKSWNFWAKSALSLLIFVPFIYSLSDNIDHILFIVYACVCLPLLPFAKKCSDDILRYYFSKQTFDEIINGGGARGAGVLYLMIIIPLTIPLAVGYFVYQIKKYRKKT